MFGDLDLKDLEPEQFESSSTKAFRQEATKAEEASVAAEHGPIPSDAVTRVMVISTPIPIVWYSQSQHSRDRKYQNAIRQKPSQKSNMLLL